MLHTGILATGNGGRKFIALLYGQSQGRYGSMDYVNPIQRPSRGQFIDAPVPSSPSNN